MIFPAVQKIKYGDKIPLENISAVSVNGVQPDTLAVFSRFFGTEICDGAPVRINAELRDTRGFCYVDEFLRLSDEKYVLHITKTDTGADISIVSGGKRGIFRGLCTVGKMLAEGLRECDVTDYPCFETRGYIEGFYGKPWSFSQREDMLLLMAANHMNTYYYAPKDDEYHRRKWREPYPEAQLEGLRALIDTARSAYIDFHYCIAPGLSMKYCSDEDFDALMKKTVQLYNAGVRGFGLLLDDIPEKLFFPEDEARFSETVNAHIYIVNKYYAALKSLDSTISLTVCPMQYHGKGNEYYISKFGRGISGDVSVFWTGRDICSRELTSPETIIFTHDTRFKPRFWDNYPVNDAEMFNEMHLGPLIGRDADLYRFSDGLISNCMEYFECSKIPLLTVADYLWNSSAYSPGDSWKNALKTVVGADDADTFAYFADHLFTSCLKDGNSRIMNSVFSKASAHMNNGDLAGVFAALTGYADSMNECRELLKKDTPLFGELKKWSEKFSVCVDIINCLFEVIGSKDAEQREKLSLLIEKYNSHPAALTNFCLQEAVNLILDTGD
ncbi:MAG: hypothetical protein GX851_02470 [Clostridiales bacterium]|nr:hypothetical protein [Clostridiales bacterium]